MKDNEFVAALRHLKLVQDGLSHYDALDVLQKEGLVPQELSPERREEILRGFMEALARHLEPQLRRTLR
jgi:hypothetical protein